MTRPHYETAIDLQNELSVAKLLKRHNYSLHKLPVQYGIDCAIHCDQEDCIVGFGEIKTRTFEMSKYPTAMVNLHKVIRARHLTETTGLPSYLIVLWTDALARISFASDFSLQMGGRTDRGDPQDVDVCAYYPISSFKVLEQI